MLNRGVLGVVYSLTLLLGVLTVLFPAHSVLGIIGTSLTYTYGTMLILGSAGAFFGVAVPNYKIEMIFLWFVGGGYLIYAITLWAIFSDRVGIPDNLPAPYGPALAVTVLTLFLFAKVLFLSKKTKALVKAAENGLG